MAEFYDHPETGILWIRAAAGGTGGGSTSVYEAPATLDDVNSNPRAHAKYLQGKHLAKQHDMQAEHRAEKREEALHKVEEAVDAVNEAVEGEGGTAP